jgi:choline dehydrogenase
MLPRLRCACADTGRDFFVKHSDDEAREARYLHRTWRKADGGFYVGIDPPAGAKVEGIVSCNADVLCMSDTLS